MRQGSWTSSVTPYSGYLCWCLSVMDCVWGHPTGLPLLSGDQDVVVVGDLQCCKADMACVTCHGFPSRAVVIELYEMLQRAEPVLSLTRKLMSSQSVTPVIAVRYMSQSVPEHPLTSHPRQVPNHCPRAALGSLGTHGVGHSWDGCFGSLHRCCL